MRMRRFYSMPPIDLLLLIIDKENYTLKFSNILNHYYLNLSAWPMSSSFNCGNKTAHDFSSIMFFHKIRLCEMNTLSIVNTQN